MPNKTIIRLSGVARNPANGFPARLLVDRRYLLAEDLEPLVNLGGRHYDLLRSAAREAQPAGD